MHFRMIIASREVLHTRQYAIAQRAPVWTPPTTPLPQHVTPAAPPTVNLTIVTIAFRVLSLGVTFVVVIKHVLSTLLATYAARLLTAKLVRQ